jgi:hypothetical protein
VPVMSSASTYVGLVIAGTCRHNNMHVLGAKDFNHTANSKVGTSLSGSMKCILALVVQPRSIKGFYDGFRSKNPC